MNFDNTEQTDNLYRLYNLYGTWRKWTGPASDLAIGHNEGVFFVSKMKCPGGKEIYEGSPWEFTSKENKGRLKEVKPVEEHYEFTEAKGDKKDKEREVIWKWSRVEKNKQNAEEQGEAIGGVRIAVDKDKRLIIVNDKHEIHIRERDGQLRKLPGSAIDVAAGGDNIWIVGPEIVDEYGNEVFKISENGSKIEKIEGVRARKITVGPSGNDPWVINLRNELFAFKDGKWVQFEGRASDVHVSKSNTVWVVGLNKCVYKYLGEIDSWQRWLDNPYRWTEYATVDAVDIQVRWEPEKDHPIKKESYTVPDEKTKKTVTLWRPIRVPAHDIPWVVNVTGDLHEFDDNRDGKPVEFLPTTLQFIWPDEGLAEWRRKEHKQKEWDDKKKAWDEKEKQAYYTRKHDEMKREEEEKERKRQEKLARGEADDKYLYWDPKSLSENLIEDDMNAPRPEFVKIIPRGTEPKPEPPKPQPEQPAS
jgi:hypothetical protein